MKLLGLDFETTGLELEKIRVVEIGAVVWDTDARQAISTLGILVFDPKFDYSTMLPEAVASHGLSVETIQKYGLHPREAFNFVCNMAREATAIVAHNGNNYDKPLCEIEMERNQLIWEPRTWIDTAQDVPYPENLRSKKLVHLAADHGFINPFPHRAIYDVMTMLQVLSYYDINEVLRNAQAPTVRLRALVDFNNKELAKARRYMWDGEKKWWVKSVKSFNVEKEMKEAPFQVIELKEAKNEVKKTGQEKDGTQQQVDGASPQGQ